MGAESVTLPIAFAAGLLSFLSPCVLPLVPTYLTYLAGHTLDQLADDRAGRARLLANAVMFVLGFSLVFIVFGAAAGGLGRFLLRYQRVVGKVAGIVVVVLGLNTAGLINLAFLSREARVDVVPRTSGLGYSFFLGMAFSAGWTPCIGPILASILALASTQSTVGQGILLLTVYSAGLAVPFLAAAWVLSRVPDQLRRLYRYLPTIKLVSGLLLVGVGVMIYFNLFNSLSRYFIWG